MTLSLALANNKGGVGKTTSTTVMAYIMLEMLRKNGFSNPRILLVDTDSQTHSSILTTNISEFGKHNSIYAVMTANKQDAGDVLANCIIESAWDPDLHVLPASEYVEDAQNELIRTPGAVYRLADALELVKNHYTVIIFDTRPSFSLATEMAIVASHQVIIPVEPRYLETIGLAKIIRKIQDIRTGWRLPRLAVGGILITKMDQRIRGHAQMLANLEAHPQLGGLICGMVPVNEAVTYAHHQHQSVFQYDSKSAASLAYTQIVRDILVRAMKSGSLNHA